MNPTVGFGRDRAEARFERTLVVTGPVTLDVSAKSGLIRIQRGSAGSVVIRGLVRAEASFFSWSHPEEQVERLALNPPVKQDGNLRPTPAISKSPE